MKHYTYLRLIRVVSMRTSRYISIHLSVCSPTFRLSRAVQLSIVLPNNLPHKVVVENEPILILCIEKRISDGFAHFRYYIVI